MTLNLIIGAGGHAKVVADILRLQAAPIHGYLDDDPALWGGLALGYSVLGAISTHSTYLDARLIIGIGANAIRARIVAAIEQERKQTEWLTARHPNTVIADSVTIGAGTVVAACAVINPDSRIGSYVIINTSASIDHDCVIGDFTHIAPGARLAGGVRVGEGVLIGMGAVILPYCTIGAGAVIGAGTVVLEDVPSDTTFVGAPGHVLKQNSQAWHS